MIPKRAGHRDGTQCRLICGFDSYAYPLKRWVVRRIEDGNQKKDDFSGRRIFAAPRLEGGDTIESLSGRGRFVDGAIRSVRMRGWTLVISRPIGGALAKWGRLVCRRTPFDERERRNGVWGESGSPEGRSRPYGGGIAGYRFGSG